MPRRSDYNDQTFPSCSNSSSSASGSDSYELSEGYTYSLEDQDSPTNCIALSDIAQIMHQTDEAWKNVGEAFDESSVRSSGGSKITMFDVLTAIDNAVDAVVDVVIPLEKTMSELDVTPSKAGNEKQKSLTISTNNRESRAEKPSSPRALSPRGRKNNEENKNGMGDRKELNAVEERDDVRASLSPIRRALSPRRRNENMGDRKESNAVEERDDVSRSLSPIRRALSPRGRKNKKEKKNGMGDRKGTNAVEEREDVSMFSFSSKNAAKANQREDEEDEVSGYFESAFQWITSPRNEDSKEEPVPVMKKKKRFFGWNRSKKTSDSTHVSDVTIDSAAAKGSKKQKAARKEMIATAKERGEQKGGTSGKDISKKGRGSRKKKGKAVIEPIVEKEEESNYDWWASFFLGGNEDVVQEPQLPKPRKGFKKIFGRKPKKANGEKRRRNKRDKYPVSGYDTVVNE